MRCIEWRSTLWRSVERANGPNYGRSTVMKRRPVTYDGWTFHRTRRRENDEEHHTYKRQRNKHTWKNIPKKKTQKLDKRKRHCPLLFVAFCAKFIVVFFFWYLWNSFLISVSFFCFGLLEMTVAVVSRSVSLLFTERFFLQSTCALIENL